MLVADGSDLLESYPHLILFPGLALFFTMMAFQLLGDGLRALPLIPKEEG